MQLVNFVLTFFSCSRHYYSNCRTMSQPLFFHFYMHLITTIAEGLDHVVKLLVSILGVQNTSLLARASKQGNVIGSVRIGECGSTLYVGLSGIVRNLIQKSTGCGYTLLSIFFLGMSRATDSTKGTMKKRNQLFLLLNLLFAKN